jgi:hypothetical protein
MKLTRKQRVALKKLYDRQSENRRKEQYGTYKQFRKTVHPLIAGDGCIMVEWCGMFIGIETDGYTHS